MTPDQYTAAWARRPSSAVSRLGGRQLLLLSARDVLRAAAKEKALVVALVAPAPAAMAGFARAARDASAPLLLLRPSGVADERGPEEARDDGAFVEAALRAAGDVSFGGPLVLLKEPPRTDAPQREHERLEREIDAGFTGLAIALSTGNEQSARDAASAAAHVCALELGLELLPLGGGAKEAAALVRELRSRGASPSVVRFTGFENEAGAFAEEIQGTAVSSAADGSPQEFCRAGVHQLISAAPFLRALRRAAPAELWEKIQTWAKDRGASLEQSAARHQRQLRDLPQEAQDKLEALCSFEAAELFAAISAQGSGARLLAHVGQMAP